MGHGGLTEQETIRFLQELLVIYEDSNFQEQLHRLHRVLIHLRRVRVGIAFMAFYGGSR